MNRNSLTALILGATTLYSFFHFVFEIDAIAYLYSLLAKSLYLLKSLTVKTLLLLKTQIALLSWEIILAFVINFFKKASVKFFLIQIPMTLLMPILVTFVVSPQKKRRFKRRFAVYKTRVMRGYRSWVDVFERFFGRHAWFALLASVVFAVGSFVIFFYYFGISFFLWLGRWGPVGTFFTALLKWIGTWVSYLAGFAKGIFYRLPMVGVVMAYCASFWKKQCVARVPQLELWRRQKLRQSIRHARSTRLHSVTVYRRWGRIRRRKQELRSEMKRLQVERTFAHIMWVGGSVPRWDRIGFKTNEYAKLLDRAMHDTSERLYIDAYLGGSIKPTYLEGGDVSWRMLRR